ncbi:MAG: intradiol ring-cleavage dioxygenase [Deltaproteobacteria bacterium]|nr:MAG: intradiol ring-cleavage dioxygenase [Deltaproteobacteria bacterium]
MVTDSFYAALLLLALFVSGAVVAAAAAPEWQCPPTKEDALGPFYKPNAPVRSSVDKGYVLEGVVKSARDCAAIPGAKIEFWLAGPDGNYDDAHRAAVLADKSGAYRFESNFPPKYTFRPPHIHVKVTAPGFRDLVTQHYPRKGEKQGTFDLVLVPAG